MTKNQLAPEYTLYYILIGVVLVVAYQLTPVARKRPYKFLEGIPVIWFVLFSFARGLILAITYPLWILLFVMILIYDHMIEKPFWHQLVRKEAKPGKYDELVKTILECDRIMVDGSEKYENIFDHPPTYYSDDGLLIYVFHYY
jgi:hypothetical protein